MENIMGQDADVLDSTRTQKSGRKHNKVHTFYRTSSFEKNGAKKSITQGGAAACAYAHHAEGRKPPQQIILETHFWGDFPPEKMLLFICVQSDHITNKKGVGAKVH